MPTTETILVDTETVACDGGPLGHPLVYFTLSRDREIECPYCSRRFVLKSEPKGH